MKCPPLPCQILSILYLAAIAVAEPWEADPEIVKKVTAQRKNEFNFEESKVPSYVLPPVLGEVEVATPEEWTNRRRGEVFRMFEEEVFGKLPADPESVMFKVTEENKDVCHGKGTLRKIMVTCRDGGREMSFPFVLVTPNAAKGPVPAFILINNRSPELLDVDKPNEFFPAEQVIDAGFALAGFWNGNIFPDKPDGLSSSEIVKLYPQPEVRPSNAWNALAAWGWGASRILDCLEKLPEIDAKKVAVIGHSRGGKTALWAGARDTRFSLVISNDSGCGGAALSRRMLGETIERITRVFPHWFAPQYTEYGGGLEDTAPFDQHFLLALMAPRHVCVGSASEDLWADPRGEYLGLAASSPVFELFGDEPLPAEELPELDVPKWTALRSYHIRPGIHNLTRSDWENYLAFAEQIWITPK